MHLHKNLDILFIVPHYPVKNGLIWKAIEYRFHSPGVLSLASYINAYNFKAAIFDCNLEQITENKFTENFDKRYADTSISYFGISSSTQTINQALRIANLLKKNRPEAKIILGGAHPSAMPENVLKNDSVDIVVIGEGEETLLKILKGDNLSNIRGIAYKENERIKITLPAERLKNLDLLPLNDYSLVPINLSKPLIGTYRKLPAAILVTSRGCLGTCTFCSRVLGHELHCMSPGRILEEIKTLYYHHNIRQIIFYDDTFISNKTRIEEFCTLLMQSGMKVFWTCSSRVDKVYPDTLAKMKKAGCHQIMYGVESFDENVLKNIDKKITKADIFYAITETKKAGIEARVSIMIGNPGDTELILKNNIKALKKLNPDIIQVTLTTPLPGSCMFTDAMKNNSLVTCDWDKYEGKDCIIPHESLSFDTMLRYYKKTYISFYLRPRFLFSQIFKINSLLRLQVLITGFFSMLPLLFKKN